MITLLWILGATLLISAIAFVGALTLFLNEKLLDKLLLILVAFSAGALIGGAFLHLIPETIIRVGANEESLFKISLLLLFGFCFFFVLEQFISWHHHHAHTHPEVEPFSYLILVSDSIHNFIDGLIIAAAFVVAFPVGIVTALVVALHEIPQEIGDYGVLVYGGFKRTTALLWNYLSGFTVVLGGLVGWIFAANLGEATVYLLPFAAGNFIYIASSDLIPEIKNKTKFKKSFIHFLVFLIGIGVMIVMKLLFN